jgi:membrane protease YdiL (CAAX protease family)
MSLPRTLPVALVAGTLMYLPAVALRTVLTASPSAAATVQAPSFLARASGFLLLASIVLVVMAVEARKTGWAQFGFRRSAGGWGASAGAAAALGVVSSVVLGVVSGGGLDATLKGMSPGLVVAMVLIATFVEELFVRGWMLGFLQADVDVGTSRARVVSAPVLTSALFFAAMHGTLARAGIDLATLATILVFTTLLGICCGIARVRSRSLLPAIATHFAGNLGGIAGGILCTALFGLPKVA